MKTALDTVRNLNENQEGFEEAGVTFDYVKVDSKTTMLDFYIEHEENASCGHYYVAGWEDEKKSYAVLMGMSPHFDVIRLHNPRPGHFRDVILKIESAADKLITFGELGKSKFLCYSIDEE